MPRQLQHGVLQQRELAARRAGGVQARAEGEVAMRSGYQSHVLHRALQTQTEMINGTSSLTSTALVYVRVWG